MKITQMTSARSGKAVANQFIITHVNCSVFQSYESVIAIKYNSEPIHIELDETYWNYSKTTSKYRSQFLGETTKETQEKIDNGTYRLTNLN